MSPPVDRFLSLVERAGNRLPHPTLLFIWLCGFVLLASGVASALGVSTHHPTTGEILRANNLLSAEGVARILQNTVSNFTSFAPVGTVLIAMLGLGVAERSGLISDLLSGWVQRARGHGLTFTVVFAGVMSSLAADAGYVVLIPLAAIVFQQAQRHPLAGIAAAFAGVSGGYSANLLLGPFDAVLSGISSEAAQLIDSSTSVSVAANYWFMLVSVFVVSTLATWVTARWVEPRLGHIQIDPVRNNEIIDGASGSSISSSVGSCSLSAGSPRGLKAVGIFTILFFLVVASGLISESGWLRQGQDITSSPFMKGIVVMIAIYALLSGYIYGRVSGHWRSGRDLIDAMEASMATMAGYLVLMFFAAQFVAYFAWSNLGIILAVQGAGILTDINVPAPLLLVVFTFVAALINLFVGSGSAKWALLAPVFVPMLMLAGISPEATQVAFRIGDSSTNIITPLMPYFGVVLAFSQHYKKDLGIGTVISMMLPYSIAFMLGWTLLLIGWLLLGLPLGW